MPLLSIVVPVYNEVKTIRQILEKINALEVDKEIIAVDDGSTDGTDRVLRETRIPCLKVIHHTHNRGKGSAVLTGLGNTQGEFIIIQDADLEYNPEDYLKLLEVVKNGQVDIVLGARFSHGYHGLFIHRIGNFFLTSLLNLLFGAKLNDYATCYKLASRKIWQELNLKARGFDLDAEIVCNALKQKKRITEVPVAYSPRGYSQGKKIRWRDGVWAIFYMFKYRFSK